MAVYSAVLDARPNGTVAIVSQSPAGWIDSVVVNTTAQTTGVYDVDYTSLGLTNPPACFSYASENPMLCSVGDGNPAWENGVSNTLASFMCRNGAGNSFSGTEQMSIMIVTQD